MFAYKPWVIYYRYFHLKFYFPILILSISIQMRASVSELQAEISQLALLTNLSMQFPYRFRYTIRMTFCFDMHSFEQCVIIILQKQINFYVTVPDFIILANKKMAEAPHSQMRAEIRHRLNKNQLYDILDINKNSSHGQIKKAYKKLALRFHPDKNKAEGSKEVFNKITHAYGLLSDNKKRAEYDEKQKFKSQNKYESFNQSYKRSYSNQDRFYTYANFYETECKQEERRARQQAERRKRQFQKERQEMERQFTKLFSKMFAASRASASRQKSKQYQKNEQKQYMQKMKKQYQEERRAKQRKERAEMMQKQHRNLILFFIVLFGTIMLGPSLMDLITSKPLYSFTKTNIHIYPLKTPILNYPYFVSERFIEDISQEKKAKINEIIDRKFVGNLKRDCLLAQNQRRSLEEKAVRERSKKRRQLYLQKARAVNDNACTVLFELNERHKDYLKIID